MSSNQSPGPTNRHGATADSDASVYLLRCARIPSLRHPVGKNLVGCSGMIEFPRLPSGDSLPLQYRWVRANGISRLVPWEFIDDEEWRESVRESIRSDSKGFDCWPFASSCGRGEVASFALTDGTIDGSVVVFDHSIIKKHGIIPGYESNEGTASRNDTYPDFWTWFVKSVIPDAQDYVTSITEQDIADWFDE